MEDEDNLFVFVRKPSFCFSTLIQEKFSQIVNEASQKRESKTQKIKRTEKTNKKKRTLAQSEITKNACCNIVQKAISLIKNE